MLTTRMKDGAATLNWNTQIGVTYRVIYKDNFAEPAWKTFGWSAPASTAEMSWTDTSIASSPTRFYRIVAQ